MRYVVILAWALLGGGAAVYFLGAPRAKAAPGCNQASDKGASHEGRSWPRTALLMRRCYNLHGSWDSTFQLGQGNRERIALRPQLSGGCTNTIALG